MDSLSPPGELTVVSAGGREGRGSPSPAPASGPVGCLVICSSTSPSSLLLRLGAAQETAGIYTVTHSVCPHLRTTLLTAARMGRVLNLYHQDQEKNHDCVGATGCRGLGDELRARAGPLRREFEPDHRRGVLGGSPLRRG